MLHGVGWVLEGGGYGAAVSLLPHTVYKLHNLTNLLDLAKLNT